MDPGREDRPFLAQLKALRERGESYSGVGWRQRRAKPRTLAYLGCFRRVGVSPTPPWAYVNGAGLRVSCGVRPTGHALGMYDCHTIVAIDIKAEGGS
jgi:hypothetical protein